MRLGVTPEVGVRLVRPLISALAHSWRIETSHEEYWRALHEARRPLIFMCWHEALFPLLWRHRRQDIVIVVSEARDGEYLRGFAESIGYGAISGSSTRGGARALLAAVRELKAGHAVAFTPDGPRGPLREVKPGVVVAAQRGGGIILPLHAAADRAWRLKSWDRFMIPQPFARVRVSYAEPFAVEPGDEGFAQGMARAQAALDELVRAAGCLHADETDTG
jgi:hypothetical protein